CGRIRSSEPLTSASPIAIAIDIASAFALCKSRMKKFSVTDYLDTPESQAAFLANCKTVRGIVFALGGSAKEAKQLKRPHATVCSWMARNSIPYRYWRAIVDLAHRRKIKTLDMEAMWDMHT